MLDRTHLAIIQQVDRLGTLTEAASSLHLTQSALSHAIKKLEQQLEVKIWVKEGRNLCLTPAGESILALANRLLPQFEHTEQVIKEYAAGEKGTLRIGIECHPCHQWLHRAVSPYLKQWPKIDIDVKQEFQFGGIGALFNHDIDALITPDPLFKPGLVFTPVFDYELMLVVPHDHPLANKEMVQPEDLIEETLFTYPVELERLDIFSQFLLPGNCRPRQHKTIETTDIMLQMVACGRGVTAIPNWRLAHITDNLSIRKLKLGNKGIHKKIYIGVREKDLNTQYIESFITMATKL